MIREVTSDDVQQICEIYNYYVDNTIVTFEENTVSFDKMKKRINDIKSNFPYYVYVKNEDVIGYVCAKNWKGRGAYRYTVESTVYLNHKNLGKGIGTILYTKLLDELKKKKIHVVMAGIALPNDKSQHLHEKFGFKKVAHLTEVGYKFNKWIDVGYWELIL